MAFVLTLNKKIMFDSVKGSLPSKESPFWYLTILTPTLLNDVRQEFGDTYREVGLGANTELKVTRDLAREYFAFTFRILGFGFTIARQEGY